MAETGVKCVVLSSVTKRFRGLGPRWDAIDLGIDEGEFFTMLGHERLRQRRRRCG